MPDILIRDVSDAVASALSEKARAAGMDRQTWLLAQFEQLASQPVIRSTYILKAFGPGPSFAQIRRLPTDIGGGATNLSQTQMNAYKKAQEYVKRNGTGDREKAYGLLNEQFEEVFETVM